MTRTLQALAIAALALVTWPATHALAQDTGNKTRGTVAALGPDTITVKARDVELKFRVTRQTVVEARGAGTRGRQAQAAGKAGPTLTEVLKTGDAVEVSYVDTASGMLRALRVRAITNSGATSEEKPSDMVSSGTVRSVTASAMTIAGPSGGGATFTQSFTIDPSTKVVAKGAGTAAAAKGGKIAITEAVGVGDKVSVSYREAGNALQASEVRVTVKSTAKPKT